MRRFIEHSVGVPVEIGTNDRGVAPEIGPPLVHRADP